MDEHKNDIIIDDNLNDFIDDYLKKSNKDKTNKSYFEKENFDNTGTEELKLPMQDSKENSFDKDLEELKQNLVNEEVKFEAFLNIKFNILNKKMIKCCKLCYEIRSKKLKEYNNCENNCRNGIKEAFKYTEEKYKNSIEQLNSCIQNAKDNVEQRGFDDFNGNVFACYKSLVSKIDLIKNDLEKEFSFYI